MGEYYWEYEKVKQLDPPRLRNIARNAALTGLSMFDSLEGYSKYLNKPRVQFLYIHHIFNDEEKKLDELLQKLKQNHTFISYSEAVERVLRSNIDKPYVTISSDDGFRNNLNAIKILDKYGAKACFFINPSIIGETSFEKIKDYCKTRLEFPPVEFLNWDEVEEIQAKGHEIGSHTMSHIRIATTPKDELDEEINRSFEVIKSHCGKVDHFAYPYGSFSDFTLYAKKSVFNAGFKSCSSAVRGCHIGSDTVIEKEELLVRRDHIILDWKTSHIMHFLINNSRKATIANNFYPASIK